jgi:hypothetical protein
MASSAVATKVQQQQQQKQQKRKSHVFKPIVDNGGSRIRFNFPLYGLTTAGDKYVIVGMNEKRL